MKECANQPMRNDAHRQGEITTGYFLKLYQQLSKSGQSSEMVEENPVLQIIAFEQNLDNQICTIRLSDSKTFIDIPILSMHIKNLSKTLHKKAINNLIRLLEFEASLVQNKISKIKLIIKSVELVASTSTDVKYLIGQPSQFNQFLDNCQMVSFQDLERGVPNSYIQAVSGKEKQKQKDKDTVKEKEKEKEKEKVKVEVNQDMVVEKEMVSQEKIAKIKVENHAEEVNINVEQVDNKKGAIVQEEILTGKDILEGKTGLFVGRLLRTRITNKETKESQLTVLILGLIDKQAELVRVTMAGKTAVRQSKQLKKGKCYSLVGLDTYQNDKMAFPQIKIKEKDFKISEVVDPQICSLFENDFHRWDHEMQSIDAQRVDVIGVIDQIDDQTLFSEGATKRVIRLTITNLFKTVKISIWSDQIEVFENANLKINQPVILENIRKKKKKFLDFTYESSIFLLTDMPELLKMHLYLLPQRKYCQLPFWLSEIPGYLASLNDQPTIVQIQCHLTSSPITAQKIIYKICSSCKKKLPYNQTNPCTFCTTTTTTTFQYKYNWIVQFSDWSSSISTVLFDVAGTQILGKNARQVSEMSQDQIIELIDRISFREFLIGVEKKNMRFLVRSVVGVDGEMGFVGKSVENLGRIWKILASL